MFGLAHLAILCTVPALAALLVIADRRRTPGHRAIRCILATLLAAASISLYAWFAAHGAPMFPNHIPLELCDASLWLIIASLITLRPALFDIAWYWALAGATQSLFTPNLVNPTAFVSIQFFVDHGLIVCASLYLVWSGQLRPRPGSVLRSFIAANIYAVLVGTFDAVFHTNYMFLRSKPPTPSLLDYLGPWPWYILTCEPLALGLFLLLYLPFRSPAQSPHGSPAPADPKTKSYQPTSQ